VVAGLTLRAVIRLSCGIVGVCLAAVYEIYGNPNLGIWCEYELSEFENGNPKSRAICEMAPEQYENLRFYFFHTGVVSIVGTWETRGT